MLFLNPSYVQQIKYHKQKLLTMTNPNQMREVLLILF